MQRFKLWTEACFDFLIQKENSWDYWLEICMLSVFNRERRIDQIARVSTNTKVTLKLLTPSPFPNENKKFIHQLEI